MIDMYHWEIMEYEWNIYIYSLRELDVQCCGGPMSFLKADCLWAVEAVVITIYLGKLYWNHG